MQRQVPADVGIPHDEVGPQLPAVASSVVIEPELGGDSRPLAAPGRASVASIALLALRADAPTRLEARDRLASGYCPLAAS